MKITKKWILATDNSSSKYSLETQQWFNDYSLSEIIFKLGTNHPDDWCYRDIPNMMTGMIMFMDVYLFSSQHQKLARTIFLFTVNIRMSHVEDNFISDRWKIVSSDWSSSSNLKSQTTKLIIIVVHWQLSYFFEYSLYWFRTRTYWFLIFNKHRIGWNNIPRLLWKLLIMKNISWLIRVMVQSYTSWF